jgi:hypothetical protein
MDKKSEIVVYSGKGKQIDKFDVYENSSWVKAE